MLKKIYVSSLLEDGLLESKRDFPDANTVYCTDMSFEDFCLQHQYSLFDSSRVKLLVGIDHFPAEKLANLVDSEIEVECCWILKSLDKRTKLYKRLNAKSNVEFCSTLDKKRDRKSFISEEMKSLGIPKQYLTEVMNVSSESKATTHKELVKFSKALGSMSEREALKTLTLYKSNSSTLEFISTLFKGTEFESYSMVRRIDNVPMPIVSSTLQKRLMSLIFLAKGDQASAKKYWDRNGYYLKEDIRVANKMGLKKLLKIYLYVDTVYSDFIRKDSEHLRLLKLIRYIHSN